MTNAAKCTKMEKKNPGCLQRTPGGGSIPAVRRGRMGDAMNQQDQQRFVAARREVIARQFEILNEMQRRAVLTTQGPLLLLAGAGSGKTTVLIHRIANLMTFGRASDSEDVPEGITAEDVDFLEDYLRHGGDQARAEALCALEPAKPWSILAITFTNKAANELKDRLHAMLGDAAADVWAMTFHSACCRILRREIDRLGYRSNFTIYDSADSERVMKDVIRDLQLDEKSFPPRMFLGIISRAKDRLQGPEEFSRVADASGDYRMEKAACAYAEYQRRLREADALDFDDIILLTVELLQQYEEVRSYYQRKFRYVLIDEYQDTNHLQYLLSSLLAGGYENFCVVGDDDQSIYRFRGATIENILHFEEQHPGAQVIRLEQNYRSTKAILKAANQVISHNQGRKGKTLWTENADGGKILVRETNSEADEAAFVASRIFKISQGKAFGNIAVLYRTNAQSNALEAAFQRNAIPYRIIGGTRFFDRAEVKDMLAYLWVINNRSDDLRLRRIINNPPRGIGTKTLETVGRLAEAEQLFLYSVIADADNFGPLEKAAPKLRAFSDLIEGLAELLDTLSLPDFYEEVLQRTGYQAMLEAKTDPDSRARLENVRELKSSIISYVENSDEPSLSGFLEEIALYTDLDQYDADAEAVVLMTMHSAKGLEFDHVFLVGMEEGLFPSSRGTSSSEDLEEERRLCYVGITRARKTLTMTYARQRMLYGHTTYGRPSRFLQELPKDCVEGRIAQPKPAYEPQRSSLYGDFDGYVPPAREAPKKRQSYSSLGTAPSASKRVQFQKGDMVRHRAFGQGMVLSVLPMGNDALLEIAFDEIGTRRLMANTASAHMEKL